MGKMTVCHGSYLSVKKPDIIKGRNTKDFGPGFYCMDILEFISSEEVTAL
ncbi:MAG: DUF3990 domain-containing protein [Lachnospiraceae bacterium]|nr:DUF3990 domain-containing protein [Lachnospiraceae bacterium]